METKQGLKTTDIKGKQYVEVPQRIIYFRENTDQYPNGQIITEIVDLNEKAVIFKASVFVGGELVSTGFAREKDGDGFINKTSFIENCETSAVGRALGNLGIGIDTSVASAEEVQNAIKQQEEPQQTKKPRADYEPPKNKDEAYEESRKKLLMRINESLDKEENAPYKAQVFEEMAKRYKVNGFMLIRPQEGGRAFTEEVNQVLKEVKEKEEEQKKLKEIGI